MEVSTNRLKLPALYLVVDTSIPAEKLLPLVEQCLQGGVNMLQLWANKVTTDSLYSVGKDILVQARRYGALLLVGEDIDLCKQMGADGVHFDGYGKPPIPPLEVKRRLGTEAIVGVTCGSSIEKLRWAEEHGADYVSFCSVFPTSSVDSCEIVPLEMIRTAKKILTIPVFASGGITTENVEEVLAAGADGVAVVSALLQAPDPRLVAAAFKEKLQRLASS